MQNRQKDEIIRDILTVCNGTEGTVISRVMFHAYIGHARAKSYLGDLIEKGLIEKDIFNSRVFRTTSTGLEYLAALEKMSEFLSIETRKVVRKENIVASIPTF